MKETEARIVYLERTTINENEALKAVAVAYDVESEEARGLEESEAPADFGDYIECVVDDMGSLFENIIEDVIKSGEDVTADFMNLLANLMEQPQAVLANMLAALAIDFAQNAIEGVTEEAEQIRE